MKKVWIDLDNSPHVFFFNPIITEFRDRGFTVKVTVRDYAQVLDLAKLFEIDYKKIGRHFGKSRIMKGIGILWRAVQMIPFVLKEKPDIAVSHGSRPQFMIGKIIGIPVVHIDDYEYSQSLPFFQPDIEIVPELLPEEVLKLRKAGKIVKYPGIKEDVYINNLQCDPGILDYLAVKPDEIVITIRPPATSAHYHNERSDELFDLTIDHICRNDKTKVIVLPRTKKQGTLIRQKWTEFFDSGRMMIPGHVLDGLNLVWYSDLVISGGGTMIREAAALEVPAYSIFAGSIGAVDKYLEKLGRLIFIKDQYDIKNIEIKPRKRPDRLVNSDRKVMNFIVDKIAVELK